MRIKIAHIALVIAILALVVSLFTAVQVSNHDNDALIDALMAQNLELQAQIDALSSQTDALELGATTLTAATWSDGQGADVTLTFEPQTHRDEDTVLLRVMQDSLPVTEVPCQWDGTVYTATAQVPAGNGYTYSLITGEEVHTLASPENPVYPQLVYLADSLNAYCNLVVGDWYIRDNILTLETSFAHIQTPQLGDTGTLTCTQASLVLKNGDTVLEEFAITPAPGDGEGSYECEVAAAVFELPELAEGEQVDLWLEATLSDGQILTACAATWYAMHSGFTMAAG